MYSKARKPREASKNRQPSSSKTMRKLLAPHLRPRTSLLSTLSETIRQVLPSGATAGAPISRNVIYQRRRRRSRRDARPPLRSISRAEMSTMLSGVIASGALGNSIALVRGLICTISVGITKALRQGIAIILQPNSERLHLPKPSQRGSTAPPPSIVLSILLTASSIALRTHKDCA